MYKYPLEASFTNPDISRLIEFKKECSRNISDYNSFKKDQPRFFKEQIAGETKYLRASRLVIGYWGGMGLKDCPTVPAKDWPRELWDECNFCFGLLNS